MDNAQFFGFNLINYDNFINLFFKLIINFIFTFALTYGVYFRVRQNRSYLFTLFISNFIVFFVCVLLVDLSLSLGFAFGIFAIFSILRFRTTTVPIKEMTYLFISLSLAIINSMYNSQIGIIELIFANMVIVATAYTLEKAWVKNENVKYLIYEKIEMVKPDNHHYLLEDLKKRTGLNIHRFEIGKIDFLKDTAELRIYYYSDDNKHFVRETSNGDDDD